MTLAILLVIHMVQSITSIGNMSIVRKTLCLNCSKVSHVKLHAQASSSSVFVLTWKMFSIGLRSGERAGILWNSAFTSYRAPIATLLACEGSLGPARRKQVSKCCLINLAKNCSQAESQSFFFGRNSSISHHVRRRCYKVAPKLVSLKTLHFDSFYSLAYACIPSV